MTTENFIKVTVDNFETKYPTGFILSEIDKLLKFFPGIKLGKFKASLFINKEQIVYKNEIKRRLIQAICERDI